MLLYFLLKSFELPNLAVLFAGKVRFCSLKIEVLCQMLHPIRHWIAPV